MRTAHVSRLYHSTPRLAPPPPRLGQQGEETATLRCAVIAVPCLHAHYVIGQDQDNCRIGTGPNQGREPPLLWSVEFVKEVVHVESNDTEPLGFLWWRRPNPGPLRLQRSRRYFVCHRSYRACRRGAISHAIGAARIRLATTTVGIQK